MTKHSVKAKSPLKDKPLRQAGQSLREERERLMDDKVLIWLLAAVFALYVPAMEWYRWWMSVPPQPWLMTFIGIPVFVIAVWRLSRLWAQLQ